MSTILDFDPETGRVSIQPEHALPLGENLRFSLQDLRTMRYLTAAGWVSSRKTLLEATPDETAAPLVIEPAVAALLIHGNPLLLEEIFINLRETVVWPKAVTTAPALPSSSASILPPSTEQTSVSEIGAAGAPAHRDVASSERAKDRPARRGLPWMTIGASVAAAVVLTLAVLHLAPVVAAQVLPFSSRPSSELVARETAVERREQSVQDREKSLQDRDAVQQVVERTSGADAKALRAERDQLQARLQSTEQALAKANLRLVMQPGSTTTTPDLAQLRATVQTQQKQIDDLTVDRSMSAARVAEQEKVIEARDSQIRTLRAQLSGGQSPASVLRAGSGADAALPSNLQEAQRVADDLRQENLQLQTRLQTKDEALAAATKEQIALAARIRELEGSKPSQGALTAIFGGTNAAPVTPLWLAAAVNAAGSIEVSAGHDSEQSAMAAAMLKCRQTRRSCELIGTYRDMCFAVARPRGEPISSTNYWFKEGESRNIAQQRATMECQKGSWGPCTPAFTICASDS